MRTRHCAAPDAHFSQQPRWNRSCTATLSLEVHLPDPCFVLGLFDTGLAAVRALARAGLPVFGFDAQPREYGFRSRYGSPAVCPPPASATELIAFLQQQMRRVRGRPVLYPTSDAFVAFLSHHREALERHFQLALPSREAVAAALDKRLQYARAAAAGVPMPCLRTPRSIEEVRACAETVEYPVVVKPAVGHLWRERFRGDKAVLVEDAGALVRLYQQLLTAGQTALIQSLIVGPNTNHYKVCAYFGGDGRALAIICLRKIRQYPVDFGVGTLMESVIEPELQALGLRFFRAMEWRGPGSIEFKRDDRDGKWKLIELNPRLWQQHALAAACGMNFPLIQYLDVTGAPRRFDSYRAGVRWLDEFRDPRSAWEHHRRGRLTAAQWAASLKAVRVCALWAADDPAPFAAAARHHVVRASQRLLGAPAPRLAESR